MHLKDFELIRPAFERTQEESIEWLVAAHRMSGAEVAERFAKVGCKPEHIGKRGHVLPDFSHTDWEKMEIFRLHENKEGLDLSERSKVFQEEVEKIFERYYPEGSEEPDDLIQVTCTGYVSPSGAQKIVSKRNWKTTVTHAYHMGCYGSMPAIRMGRGFLSAFPEKKKVDVVHTEFCTLHVNPSLHETDQLVSQSLFADGFIKYSIQKDGPGIAVLNMMEEIIPDTLSAMSWNVMGWGFQMSLAKEVPVFITRHLPSFYKRLCQENPKDVLFAVHPGGPKILSYVQKCLGITDKQMRFSYSVLKKYGNMSSATLPHIWQEILLDEEVADGTKIVSFAFGPGLTIAGAVMEKRCGI